MKTFSLLLLRVSLGLLMFIWGIDKIVNPAHASEVADTFYLGLFGWPALLPVLGAAQIGLGLLVVLGVWRRVTYPLMAVVTGFGLLAVWKSIVDPWGWYLEGANVLFYPSLIIFAGVLVLLAFQEEDELRLGAGRAAAKGVGGEPGVRAEGA